MENKRYTVAIDLGESNIVVAVGSLDADSQLCVDAIVSLPSAGVKAGAIYNAAKAEASIRNAITIIEDELQCRITSAFVGLSGEFVRCASHTDFVFVTDARNGVSSRDVEALYGRMNNVQAPDDEIIMSRIPQSYVVDNNEVDGDPVGSFGRRLSATFNFVLCRATPIDRLELALRRLNIKIDKVVSNALVVADAVATDYEKDEGVAVIDIGGGVTDVTIYCNNIVRYTASIPMGANAINQDIRTLGIPDNYIEELKRQFGCAVVDMVVESAFVNIRGRKQNESKNINLRNLATIIEARMCDIVEFVMREINDSGYADRLTYGLVLTGGGSQLKSVDELFSRLTRYDVRIAKPEESICEASREKILSPSYSAAIGILLQGVMSDHASMVSSHMRPPLVHKTEVESEVIYDPPREVQQESREPEVEEVVKQEYVAEPEPEVVNDEVEESDLDDDYDADEPQRDKKSPWGWQNLRAMVGGAFTKINDKYREVEGENDAEDEI